LVYPKKEVGSSRLTVDRGSAPSQYASGYVTAEYHSAQQSPLALQVVQQFVTSLCHEHAGIFIFALHTMHFEYE
jgi:hypothetical protein